MRQVMFAVAMAVAFVGTVTILAVQFPPDPRPAIVTCGERVDTAVEMISDSWGAVRYKTGDGKTVRAPSSCIVDYPR